MDMLVIGGSVFVGRAMVDEALARGAHVTVFNRGLSAPTPPGAHHVRGDRAVAADLEQVAGRHFDLVVDTCGYVPAEVAMSAGALARTCGHYTFVSSLNAYPGWPREADHRAEGVHDGDPDATRAPEELSEANRYGWLKTGCERAVVRAFGERQCTVLRAGSLVGPGDSEVGRLPWWLDRVSRGGEVLVPGTPSDPVALIDARDLARFALRGVAGTFDAPGPFERDTRADLMTAARDATGADAEFTYVDSDWLPAQGVQFWTELPLWIPSSLGPSVFSCPADDAAAAGLAWRPLAETVADTWAWQSTLPGGWRPAPDTPGLAPERERDLLAAWHAR